MFLLQYNLKFISGGMSGEEGKASETICWCLWGMSRSTEEKEGKAEEITC
jgi:hypothetical protein